MKVIRINPDRFLLANKSSLEGKWNRSCKMIYNVLLYAYRNISRNHRITEEDMLMLMDDLVELDEETTKREFLVFMENHPHDAERFMEFYAAELKRRKENIRLLEDLTRKKFGGMEK